MRINTLGAAAFEKYAKNIKSAVYLKYRGRKHGLGGRAARRYSAVYVFSVYFKLDKCIKHCKGKKFSL